MLQLVLQPLLRVQVNEILGLPPGEVYTQCNVGNQANHSDMNTVSCIEYAVEELKVSCQLHQAHVGHHCVYAGT
jgi:hypothetical protein